MKRSSQPAPSHRGTVMPKKYREKEGRQRGTGAQRGLIHGKEDGREHEHIGGNPHNAGPQRALEGIRNCGAGGLDGNGGCGHGFLL